MTLQDNGAPRARPSAPRVRRDPVEQDRRDRIMSIREWCELNGFSLSTGQRMLKRGEGPMIVQLSARRHGIRVSDNDAWQESRLRAYGQVFLTNHRSTSDAGAAASDSAVLASIALQYGVPVDVIRKALMRDSRGQARTPLGTVLDMLAAERKP